MLTLTNKCIGMLDKQIHKLGLIFKINRIFRSAMLKCELDKTIQASGSNLEKKGSYDSSVMREKFKYYKQRNKNPDLSEVLDLRVSNRNVLCRPILKNSLSLNLRNAIKSKEYFIPLEEWTYSILNNRPGLYILNGIINRAYQLKLISKCLKDYPEPPNLSNLNNTTTAQSGPGSIFKEFGSKLRWVTMGNDYNWTEKIYASKARLLLPEDICSLAQITTKVLGLDEIFPDALIINYYPEKATLSPHVDRNITRPLISVSLGQCGIYLTGGTVLNDPVDAIQLHSGDILIMHEQQRLVYHAVPRIIKTCTFASDPNIDDSVIDYANKHRVNITIRQVD